MDITEKVKKMIVSEKPKKPKADKNAMTEEPKEEITTKTLACLDILRDEIASLSEKVRSLQCEGGERNKEAIATAVQDLLNAKRELALANDGIGVDGKPFEEAGFKKRREVPRKR